jgi:hypothetical protein
MALANRRRGTALHRAEAIDERLLRGRGGRVVRGDAGLGELRTRYFLNTEVAEDTEDGRLGLGSNVAKRRRRLAALCLGIGLCGLCDLCVKKD